MSSVCASTISEFRPSYESADLRFRNMVGEAEAMQHVFRLASRIIATDCSALLFGEDGTGRETLARAIHNASQYSRGPFLTLKLAGALPDRQENEISALLAAASGGTFYIHDIALLTPSAQEKFARLLFQAANKNRPEGKTRVIAATRKNLVTMMRRGDFREDLLQLLGRIAIKLPAVRERGEDRQLLIQHFARQCAAEANKPNPELTDEAMELLLKYDWPGNVAEMQNVVRRLVAKGGPLIDSSTVPALLRDSDIERSPRTLAEVEVEHIRAVLSLVEGNRTRAAGILGIDRKTLRERLKRAESREPAVQ